VRSVAGGKQLREGLFLRAAGLSPSKAAAGRDKAGGMDRVSGASSCLQGAGREAGGRMCPCGVAYQKLRCGPAREHSVVCCV